MRRHAQCTAAARALNRRHAAVANQCAVGAEQQFFDEAIELSVAGRRDVTLRLLLLIDDLLGLFDSVEDRRVAVVVLIDADAEIDFPREFIRAEQLHDAEDGIGRKWLQLIEHRLSSSIADADGIVRRWPGHNN